MKQGGSGSSAESGSLGEELLRDPFGCSAILAVVVSTFL